MIYQPAEDSFLLEKYVILYSQGKKVLDLGSGSGIQAKAAIKSGAKSVLASDIDQESINNLKNKDIRAVKSNLFSNIKEKFDLIVFNPPYLPRDKREDKESQKATTGGKEGDEIIIKFLKKAPNHLEKNGTILLLLSSLTPQTRINKLLLKSNLKKKEIGKQNIFMETLSVWEIKKVI